MKAVYYLRSPRQGRPGRRGLYVPERVNHQVVDATARGIVGLYYAGHYEEGRQAMASALGAANGEGHTLPGV